MVIAVGSLTLSLSYHVVLWQSHSLTLIPCGPFRQCVWLSVLWGWWCPVEGSVWPLAVKKTAQVRGFLPLSTDQ